MAVEATGRRAALIELDPRYCDVIVRRWQEGTGWRAALEPDGRSFAEFAAERGGGTGEPNTAAMNAHGGQEALRAAEADLAADLRDRAAVGAKGSIPAAAGRVEASA